MTEPRQYTLAIERPLQQRLDNFVVGDNAELFSALKGVAADFSGFWIFGARGSGRSHLLRGSCSRAADMGLPVAYVGCGEFISPGGQVQEQELAAALQQAARFGELVAIDDISACAGLRVCEELLMALYQRLLESRGRLLISHLQPATATSFTTADLNSRLRSLMHFHISPLRDEHKAELLRARADSRGFELTQAVLDYWLARGPRDMGALLTDLELLDRASLVHKQRVTIPLLKQVLGY